MRTTAAARAPGGVPRPSRASWLVEKGTELGVRAFRFLDCERSARPLDDGALDRLRRVARTAVVQCGRSRLPEVTGPHRLEEALVRRGSRHADSCWTRRRQPARAVLARRFDLPLLPAIGPEGGFTAAEVAAGRGRWRHAGASGAVVPARRDRGAGGGGLGAGRVRRLSDDDSVSVTSGMDWLGLTEY